MKYRPGDNKVMFKVTNDLQTISIKFDQTEDTKKVEMLLVKSSEILANYKYTGGDFSKFCYRSFAEKLDVGRRKKNKGKKN
jgi:serine protease inhibitor ecotin